MGGLKSHNYGENPIDKNLFIIITFRLYQKRLQLKPQKKTGFTRLFKLCLPHNIVTALYPVLDYPSKRLRQRSFNLSACFDTSRNRFRQTG